MASSTTNSSTRTTTSHSEIIQINATTHLPLKLNSNNFPSWHLQFDTFLTGLDLIGYVNGTYPCPAPTIIIRETVTSNPAYLKWIRQDKLILHAIITSLTESVISLIATSKSSQEAMTKLTNLFASITRSRVMSLKKKLTLST